MFPQGREVFECFSLEAHVVSPGSSLPAHKHERAHLLIVYAGLVFDATAEEEHQVGPGELLVRPAGITHTNRVGTVGAHLVCIDMAPSLTAAFAPMYGQAWASARLTFPMVRQLPEQILSEMAAHDSASRRILPALVEQLLGVGARAAVSGGHPEWLRRALELLRRSWVEGIELQALARHAGVSPSRLSHGFREHVGRSIGDFLRELRVDAAARALRESDEPIAAIAASCGFSDQSHLSRTFRELRGVTPLEYRRQHRFGNVAVPTQ